jgi:hypothetical protein
MRYFGKQKGVEEYVASSIYFSVFVEPFMFGLHPVRLTPA